MQEYFSSILGMEIGNYYHIANNFHYYEDKREMLEALASVKDYCDEPYVYCKKFNSLKEFDKQIKILSNEETKMRNSDYQYSPDSFVDSFFKDWYSVLYHKNHSNHPVIIENPELHKIMDKAILA